MTGRFLFLLALLTWGFEPLPSYAEENKGFSLSNLFKIKKAEEQETYLPVDTKKDPALVLTGTAGPRMPAVPAGEIKKEVIVKTPVPAKQPAYLKTSATAQAAPQPVTVKYNPAIPFMSLIFQNGYQKNLETGHKDIIKTGIQKIKNGHYRGTIRIQSFSDKGHQTAMDRAQQVRKHLVDSNIPLTDLDVQALPGLKQGNIIHIFLLGES